MRIFFESFDAVGLPWYVGIVGHDLFVKLLLLFLREGWGFGGEAIGNDDGLQLLVVVVGKL